MHTKFRKYFKIFKKSIRKKKIFIKSGNKFNDKNENILCKKNKIIKNILK